MIAEDSSSLCCHHVPTGILRESLLAQLGREAVSQTGDQQPVSHEIARNTSVSAVIPRPRLFTRLESSLGSV